MTPPSLSPRDREIFMTMLQSSVIDAGMRMH